MVKFPKFEEKSYTHISQPFHFIEQDDSQIRVENIGIVQYRIENALGQSNIVLVGKKKLSLLGEKRWF